MGCGASTDEGYGNSKQNNANNQENQDLEENLAIYDNVEKKKKDNNDGDLFGVAEDETNEQFMAVKPWIGALKEPSNAPKIDLSAPPKRLELEYVNGYRCEDSRQNLFWTNQDGVCVFMSAAVGVVHNVVKNTQQFFGAGKVGEVAGHNDDIEALHVNRDRTICATGQRGKNPSIFVWNIADKSIIAQHSQGRNTRAVRQLKFSPCGKYIFTCDVSDDHVVHIFSATQSGQKLGALKTGNDPVYDMDTSSGPQACALATKRGVTFVNWTPGGNMEKKTGMRCREWIVSCQFFADGNKLAAGSTTGVIYIFNGVTAMKNVQLHQGGIHSICIQEGKLLASGFNDQTLKVYDAETLSVEQEYPLKTSYARSLDYKNGQILVGTRDGQIIAINNSTKQQTLILNGHGTGEAWGLDIASDGNIITTGDDNKICNFNPQKNQTVTTGIVNSKPGQSYKIGGASTLSIYPPNQCSRAVAINPKNGHVAIATNEGELSIRASKDQLNDQIKYQKFPGQNSAWIEVMAYSPNGQYLAVGTHFRKIYILDANNNYQKVGECSKHNSAILNIDWTLDSQSIRSVCQAYELLFFTVDGTQLTDGATTFRDEEYASQSCKLGWWVQGIFPPSTDGSHVNGVARNHAKNVIATGDDWGFVNLYRNPNAKGSQANSYRAHSSHVVRVKFSTDDKYLYSIGGYDRCLMKWKVI